jgi:hypothetical protein
LAPASVSSPQAAPLPKRFRQVLCPDRSAHRLDGRKIDADQQPPAAQPLIARQDDAWNWRNGEGHFQRSDVLRPLVVVLIPGLPVAPAARP